MAELNPETFMKYCPVCHKRVPVFEYQRFRTILFENGEEIKIPEAFSYCKDKHVFMTSAQLDGNLLAYSKAIEKYVNQ